MRYVSHRIGVLELRRSETIGGDKQYLEVVEWMKDDKNKDYCYTIAIFEEYSEGHKLISVGDRIILGKQLWVDFGVLVTIAFEFLKQDAVVSGDVE